MNQNDIRRLYTEQVANLMAQGYQIYPDTMSGSQGEIARIDLTNGSELLRVLLEKQTNYEDDADENLIVIMVGKYPHPFRNRSGFTIWNQELEVRSLLYKRDCHLAYVLIVVGYCP